MIKTLLRNLDIAARNLLLYPETNKVRGLSLAAVKKAFDEILSEDNLRIFIEKGQFIYNNELVFQDKSAEHGLVSPLFRDGIHSIEFIYGIPYEEIETFINLLNKFKVLDDDADDDLVTAIWEADLKFISYDTADEYWETDESLDIATLKVSSAADYRSNKNNDNEEDDNFQKNDEFAEDEKTNELSELFKSLNDSEDKLDDSFLNEKVPNSGQKSKDGTKTFTVNQWQELLHFSENEKELLKQMIEAESKRNIIADSLEILINLMYCRPEHPDNSQVMDYLVDEVRHALSIADFDDVNKCIMAIMSFSQSGHKKLSKLAGDFSRLVASEDSIKAMAEYWETTEELSESYLNDAYQFLISLPPDSIKSILPILAEIKSSKIKKMLLWVVAYKIAYASQDFSPILNNLKASIIIDFIKIVRSPQIPFPTLVMIGLAKHPNSSEVRQAAAEALVENDPKQIKILFPLIKDPNPGIAHMALKYLRQFSSSQAESHLIDHLTNIIEEGSKSRDHIIQCFYTLGHCGTEYSLDFLAKILLRKNLKAFLGMEDNCYREGAAIALLLLTSKTGGAQDLLKKATSSSFRDIKEACNNAERTLARGIN